MFDVMLNIKSKPIFIKERTAKKIEEEKRLFFETFLLFDLCCLKYIVVVKLDFFSGVFCV